MEYSVNGLVGVYRTKEKTAPFTNTVKSAAPENSTQPQIQGLRQMRCINRRRGVGSARRGLEGFGEK